MDDLFQIRQTKCMGRGVFALKDIEIGTKILKLDERSYIHYGCIYYHSFFCKISHFQQLELDKKIVFAIYMAFISKNKDQKNCQSEDLIKYIENLPPYFHNLICWKQDELDKLKDRNLIVKMQNRKLKMINEFERVKKCLAQKLEDFQNFYPFFFQSQHFKDRYSSQIQSQQEQQIRQKPQQSLNQTYQTQQDNVKTVQQYQKLFQDIEFDEMLHFYSAIQSRNVYYQFQRDLKSQIGALIPLLQLFNHSPEGQVQKQVYYLRAVKNIKRGQQIFVSYGKSSIEKEIQSYGFVIDETFESTKNQFLSSHQIQIPFDQTEEKDTKSSKINKRIAKERDILAERFNNLYEAQNKDKN